MSVWWDRKEAKVLHSVSQLVGSWTEEVWRFRGDFHTALGAICQKSKPFPIFASPFSFSLLLPSLFITTSAFLLICHTPFLTVSHLFFSQTPSNFTSCPLDPRLQFSLQLGVLEGWFLIPHYSDNKLIIKEEQQCWTPWCNRLTLTCCGSWKKCPELCKWLIWYSRREHLGVQTEVVKWAYQGKDRSNSWFWWPKTKQQIDWMIALKVALTSWPPSTYTCHDLQISLIINQQVQESFIMLTADKVAFLL